jgi:hypothetical protein
MERIPTQFRNRMDEVVKRAKYINPEIQQGMRLVNNEEDHEALKEQLQNSIQSTKASIIKGVKARALIEALGLDANSGVLHGGGLIKEIQATAVGNLISTKECRPTQIETSQRRLCPTIMEISSDPSLPEPKSDWIANDSMDQEIGMASEETVKSLSQDQVAELDISSSVSISDWIKHQ